MPTLPARSARLRSALSLAVVAAGLATAAATLTATTPAAGAPSTARPQLVRTVAVHRGGRDRSVTFWRTHPGEAFLTAKVSARGVSWAQAGNESAVVSAYVDGHYATDIVVPSSTPVTRQFALGSLSRGRHTLRLHYATPRSPSDRGVARIADMRFGAVRPSSPGYAAASNAPILYGRNIATAGGRFQNNHTDTPLVAWHEVQPAATPGHSVIQYSVVWSNEDGGTAPGALLAQWGRTTDIEWVYRVEVDARGRRVPGTGVIQAAGHDTLPFAGKYDGTHPLIETCTLNNNVCDTIDDPMRFALSTREVLPAGQPREHEMDRHPWTYQVMARELVREGKVESPSDPSTPLPGDPRSYLYLALDHTTDPTGAAAGVGLAVDVSLKGDPTTYTSNHGIAGWSLARNGPAATTVELPLGTTVADIASISVRRVPTTVTDNGADLTVTRLFRAFFLDSDDLPQASFARWTGSLTLTAASPTAPLWPAAG